MWALKGSPFLAAASLLFSFARAEAHPLALSGFDAWAGDRDVRIELKLDAQSVLSMLARAHPAHPPAGLPAIRDEAAAVFAYVGAHLQLSNDGKPCRLVPATDLVVHEGIGKVLLEERFECPADLDLLAIESTLFNEESPTPQVICNFHYRRALEHYFFSGGVRQAQVPVHQLQQVLPAAIDGDRPAAMTAAPPGAYANASPLRPVRHNPGFVPFVWQGVMHILSGLDHVLFVVSLVIAARSRRELVLIVSSFTVAHSITLVLGTFDLVRASPRLVEPLIALSIIYVAVENVVRRAPPARPAITFGFGLVHGLGFSAALRELGLPARELLGPLVGFNVGVELGQLTIVLPLLPLVIWLRRGERTFRRVSFATNAAVAIIASMWFVRRLMGV